MLGEVIDPKFPDYAYVAKPLVRVFGDKEATKSEGNLFLGEWVKLLDDPVPGAGRVHVKYRGGEGYILIDDLTRKRHLEIFFIDVSKGDSILIQSPDDRRILIDGGETEEAFEFIKNKYRLDKEKNYIDFDAVIATHSDSDHAKGLIKILECPKIAVKRFYHNGLFPQRNPEDKKASKLDPHDRKFVWELKDRPEAGDASLTELMGQLMKAVETAKERLTTVIGEMEKLGRRVDSPVGGFVCKRLDAKDDFVPPFNDANKLAVKVLWPRAVDHGGQPSCPWYGDVGKTVNGNSVVLSIRHGKNRILLTGDLNTLAMGDLLKIYKKEELGADVYKAAHHGSQEFSVDFLKAVEPDAGVISSGDNANDEYGHPRAVLVGTITRYSKCAKPAVFCTELAACFSKLDDKEQEKFKSGEGQLYERAIQGIVHLRSSGEKLCLGTVYGRKAPAGSQLDLLWKWDIWPED
jgi:competence protein ComEC